MSTNVYIVHDPCFHCGQSLTKPVHLGKLVSSGLILHVGRDYEARDELTARVPVDAAGWRRIIRLPSVEVRDEYRVTRTKEEALGWLRGKPRTSIGYFR